MKVYISGPITGVDNFLENFNNAELYLKNHGCEVVNPAKINQNMPADTTYEEYMKIDLAMLDMCDAIYMLNGWQDSKGANREFGYAWAKGITLMHEAIETCSNPTAEMLENISVIWNQLSDKNKKQLVRILAGENSRGRKKEND